MIEDKLAALDQATRPELIEQWIALLGSRPPSRISRGLMLRMIACEIQWRDSGLPRAQLIRRLQRLVALAGSSKPSARPGTRLVRDWNGRRHVVDVTSEGYVWNGTTWRSLSAIAREITGTKWSGPRFFGVSA